MDAQKLYRKGLFLEYLTVDCNIAEAVASIVLGGLPAALSWWGLDLKVS